MGHTSSRVVGSWACQTAAACQHLAMSNASARVIASLSKGRSKISNGTRLLANVDGRSAYARRFRDLIVAFEAEVGGTLTELERGLVRQAAAVSLKA